MLGLSESLDVWGTFYFGVHAIVIALYLVCQAIPAKKVGNQRGLPGRSKRGGVAAARESCSSILHLPHGIARSIREGIVGRHRVHAAHQEYRGSKAQKDPPPSCDGGWVIGRVALCLTC